MPQAALQSQANRKSQCPNECNDGRNLETKNAGDQKKQDKSKAHINHRSEKRAYRSIYIAGNQCFGRNLVQFIEDFETHP